MSLKITSVYSRFLIAVFVNRDRLTGFGTPWEIRFQANYTVLRKRGNVDGYSALLSYIPDLELGKDVMLLFVCVVGVFPCLGCGCGYLFHFLNILF